MMKPGGHGAIWKLMWDEGVFDWLQGQHGRRAALVRQISNPMAGERVLCGAGGRRWLEGRALGGGGCGVLGCRAGLRAA